MKIFFLISLAGLSLVSCGSERPQQGRAIGQAFASRLGCSDFKSKAWDQFFLSSSPEGLLPQKTQVMKEFKKALIDRHVENSAEILTEVDALYSLISEEAPIVFDVKNQDDMNRALVGLELGAEPSAAVKQLKDRIQNHLQKIQELAKNEIQDCPSAESPQIETSDDKNSAVAQLKKITHPVAVGGLEVLATTYQSCKALRLPAMTEAVPDLSGVSVCGKNPQNGGKKRCITDLHQMLRSHYYLNGYEKPNAACIDTTKNPLIYDFGGKPDYRGGQLNLFKNEGSGGKVLGIDCSAFVFSAFATQGLKMKSDTPLRPEQVLWFGAADFKNPKTKRFDCIDHITVNKDDSLHSGDIIAVNSHVVLVDEVGVDPLGLLRISSISQCNPNVISHRNYDFTILQSSASKNGIGANHFVAKDYFEESPVIRNQMQKYAIAACKAKFKAGGAKPRVSELSVVRHSGIPQCREKQIHLKNQACIQRCD